MSDDATETTAPETATTEIPPTEPAPPPAARRHRPTGHIPDTPEQKARHKSTKHLLGAPARLPPAWSLLAATPPFKSQRETSSCVGFDVWRCVDTRLEVMGVPHEEHSARGIYTFAREWARGSAVSEGIADQGSSPSDAFAALAEWGVPLERDFPSDAEALDRRINEEADVETLKNATAFKVTGVYAIDDGADGEQIERDVMQAVSSGHPVSFAIAAGDLFQAYDGSGDVAPEPNAAVPTNHAVMIVAYETDASGEVVFTGISPWEDWGKGQGRFTFRRALLADRRTVDFYVVTLGPKDAPVPAAKPEPKPEAVSP